MLQELLLLQVVTLFKEKKHLMQLHKQYLKIVHHLKKCRTEINETFVNETDFINITMTMYNLIEYSDIYSDTSGSLWQFLRD